MRRKRSALIVIGTLSLLGLICALPLMRFGSQGVYFVIDPEVMYIGNALSYIKNNIIHYRDHPGTPVILLNAFSYWPLRIYAKIIAQTPFIKWAFNKLRFLFLYTRLFQLTLFITSIGLFLAAIFNLTKLKVAVVAGWLALFVINYLPGLATKVSAENVTFFIVSIWLYIFTSFSKNKSPFKLLILSILSGLAIAVKYNNFALGLASLGLVIIIPNLSLRQKIYNFILNIIAVVGGFVVGTWPIRGGYPRMIDKVLKIIISSGPDAAHAKVDTAVFDLSLYFNSAKSVLISERYAFLFIVVGLLMFLYLIWRKKRFVPNSLHILILVSVFSSIILMKYPLSYYQLPNILLLVFGVTVLLSKNKFLLLLMMFLLTFRVQQNISTHLLNRTKSYERSIALESYIKKVSSGNVTLWDFGTAQDFVYLWIRGWSRGIFNDELKKDRPDLLELKADYETVNLTYTDTGNIFDVCWDDLYIRENRGKIFLEKYPERKFITSNIGETGIMHIKSSHCAD
jgi:hypothetical protein